MTVKELRDQLEEILDDNILVMVDSSEGSYEASTIYYGYEKDREFSSRKPDRKIIRKAILIG